MNRMALLVLAVFASWTASAAEPPKTLDISGLQRLGREFAELDQFRDNVFLYDEKRTQLARKLDEKYDGAAVCLSVQVLRVERQRVVCNLQPRDMPDEKNRLDKTVPPAVVHDSSFPYVVVESEDFRFKDPQATTVEVGTLFGDDLAGRPEVVDERRLALKIGPLLELALAKRLRRGDRLELRGRVDRIVLVGKEGSDDKSLAVFIKEPKPVVPEPRME